MSARRYLARLGARIATATMLGSVMIIAATEAPSSALTLTNTSPSGLYNCNPYSTAITASCLSGALSDFNAARRKEGLGPMVLPSTFASMSVPNQLFTLTNIERRDRGIPTFLMLSSNLTSFVLTAANSALDPLFPSWTVSGGSNWASPKNTLWADFVWMYDDGIGSGNLDCTRTNTSGCWGHRYNILGNYGAPRIMGAALGSTGVATIMLGSDTHDAPVIRTPNAPALVWAPQISYHRDAVGWSVPAYRGATILRYEVRVDGGAWLSTGLRRAWTTPSLKLGWHMISVRSYNRYGYSGIKYAHPYIR